MGSELYLNSLYLLGSSGVLAFFGFAYWFLAARSSQPYEVGMTATLVSVMTYIATASQLGLNVGILRFLAAAMQPQRIVNTSLTIVGFTAALLTAAFVMGSGVLIPSLVPLWRNGLVTISFVLFIVCAALQVTFESCFISLRKSGFVLARSTILSVLKVGFVFALAPLGAYGLFTAWGIAGFVAVVASYILLARATGFRYRPAIDWRNLQQLTAFSAGNYVATLIGGLSAAALPVLITAVSDPSVTARYYIAMSYGALLYTVPIAVCNSLFAEGVIANANLRRLTLRAAALITAILVPAIIIVIVWGVPLLYVFGAEYARDSYPLLAALAVSSVPISFNTICWTVLNLRRAVVDIVIALSFNAVVVLVLAYLLAQQGLPGIGAAWFTGQIATSALYVTLLWRRFGRVSKGGQQ